MTIVSEIFGDLQSSCLNCSPVLSCHKPPHLLIYQILSNFSNSLPNPDPWQMLIVVRLSLTTSLVLQPFRQADLCQGSHLWDKRIVTQMKYKHKGKHKKKENIYLSRTFCCYLACAHSPRPSKKYEGCGRWMTEYRLKVYISQVRCSWKTFSF